MPVLYAIHPSKLKGLRHKRRPKVRYSVGNVKVRAGAVTAFAGVRNTDHLLLQHVCQPLFFLLSRYGYNAPSAGLFRSIAIQIKTTKPTSER